MFARDLVIALGGTPDVLVRDSRIQERPRPSSLDHPTRHVGRAVSGVESLT